MIQTDTKIFFFLKQIIKIIQILDIFLKVAEYIIMLILAIYLSQME